MIRLGHGGLTVDEQEDSLDEFSRIGEGLIPYFLEAVRYDKVLAEHLELRQEGSMLIITIKV